MAVLICSKDGSKIELELMLWENEKLIRQKKKLVTELEDMGQEKNQIKGNTINKTCESEFILYYLFCLVLEKSNEKL